MNISISQKSMKLLLKVITYLEPADEAWFILLHQELHGLKVRRLKIYALFYDSAQKQRLLSLTYFVSFSSLIIFLLELDHRHWNGEVNYYKPSRVCSLPDGRKCEAMQITSCGLCISFSLQVPSLSSCHDFRRWWTTSFVVVWMRMAP